MWWQQRHLQPLLTSEVVMSLNPGLDRVLTTIVYLDMVGSQMTLLSSGSGESLRKKDMSILSIGSTS
jgi:hypothetical protein